MGMTPYGKVLGGGLEVGHVSENSGTPKSSILIGFSIIFTIHFGGTTIFGNIHMYIFTFHG